MLIFVNSDSMLRKIFVILIILSYFTVAFAEELFFIDNGETIYLQSENNTRSADDWFITQHGQRVKIAEGIIVELKNAADAETVFSIPEVKSYEQLLGKLFLVIPADSNLQFELSRKLLDNSLVKNSHPNLIRERKPR
jgi:hypothetical protein